VIKAIVDAPFSHNIACGLREILLGENALETERLWQKMLRRTQYFGRTSVTIAAMSAVDMALWDLKGKKFGLPIHTLLGGKHHSRIPAYASILFGKDGEETRDIGRKWIERGYRAVKFGWEPMGQSEALDLALVRGAREGIGPENTLLIDAGCVWDARTALRRAQQFAEFNPAWLEEPLRPWDIDGYVWLRDVRTDSNCGGRGRVRSLNRSSVHRPARVRHLSRWTLRAVASRTAPSFAHASKRINARLCNHCYTSPNTVAASLPLAQHLSRRVHLRGLRG
jgi:L-alanine-DL-glutamate epimerase-like enolase superfamily enzyme